MRVTTPVNYPPHSARHLHDVANKMGKDLLRALGYSTPNRLRTSRLVSKADKLRISEERLPARGLFEIVADTYKMDDAQEDERRRRTVKTERHRVRKRLVEKYKPDMPTDQSP